MTRNSDARRRLSFHCGQFVLVALVVLTNESLVFAQTARSRINWATGSELRRQLAKPIGVTWERVPLRDAIERLSKQSRVAMFLDRNVDPNLRITLQAKSAPLERIVEKLASSLNLGVAQVGPVIYLGPPFNASRLSTLAVQRNDELRELTAKQAAKWRKSEPWSWPRLAQPKAILSEMAKANKLTLKNLNRIPHDLWPRADLPAMTLPERLTLLLVGFKLSYQFDSDDNVRFVRFPSAVSVERQYRLRNDQMLEQLKSTFPQADIEASKDMAVVRTTVEEHAEIRSLLDGTVPQRRQTVTQGLESKRYTLRIVDREFVRVIKQLSEQIGLDLVVGDGVSINAKQLVTIDVTEATVDQLMTELLQQVGLTHERSGNKLTLLPK